MLIQLKGRSYVDMWPRGPGHLLDMTGIELPPTVLYQGVGWHVFGSRKRKWALAKIERLQSEEWAC